MITILANPPAPTVPSIEAGDETKNALLKLALNFDRTYGTNNPPPPYYTNKQSTFHNKYWFHYQPHQ